MIERRRFVGRRDLAGLQALAARRTEALGIGASLHPGDVPHRIWNGNRRSRPEDVVAQWFEHDRLIGFALIWPKDQSFDFVVEPDVDAVTLATLLDAAIEIVRDEARVEIDVSGDDPPLVALLEDRGFTRTGIPYALTAQEIGDIDPVDGGNLRLRTVTLEDAARLAEVHASAFGSSWSESTYREHMERNLGYSPAWELVAETPDDTFAGFTEMWLDHRNGTGYFEPVGVHADHRRRGIGRMLLTDGMRRMKGAGMTTATVLHELDDPASTAFYASCGFERVATVARWEKRFDTPGS